MLPDDPDIFDYTREIIPGGCRQIDRETGEHEDFFCIMCHGGQPGACDDYPKAQELLEKAQEEQQETISNLERLEDIVKEERSGQLSIIYSHNHWEATLDKDGGINLKAAALTLHEAVKNLMNEYIKERELKFKQVLYKKIEAMGGHIELNKTISELQQKILEVERISADPK